MSAGSSLWQTIFISFALLLVAFEIVRGWRLGVVRQLVRLLAIVCAYAAALFGGRMLLPFLRPLLQVPDLFISIGAGAILALLVYSAINVFGAVLFKRTAQQQAGLIRVLYGLCGAALGVLFGLFSVWLIVVGVRCVGAIANAQLRTEAAKPHAPLARSQQSPLISSVAKLQNSIELGSLGEVVKGADAVPTKTYQTLGKLGTVVSNPQSAARFLSYPGAKQLTENPRIIALRDDPEIIELIQHQRFMDLLHHPRLIEAMNDPTLAAQVRSFDFQKALNYATGAPASSPNGR